MAQPPLHKTRLAPTPSGYLHLGNVFSFAVTIAIAQQEAATLLLRIDDMDRDRVQQEYVQDIFDTLRYLGIAWNEGPWDIDAFNSGFSQRYRLPLYNATLQQLRDMGVVYACNCSRSQILRDSIDGGYPGTCRLKNIPLDAADVSWRLITDDAQPVSLTQLYGGREVSTLPASVRDFIVKKKDGFPAYQLSSVMDDLHFGIDTIVRGQDLWDSSLAQLYLASVLGKTEFLKVRFYHHALLTTQGGNKLSKSAGDTSIQYMVKHGATAQDIWTLVGYMAGIKQPVKSLEELIPHLLPSDHDLLPHSAGLF